MICVKKWEVQIRHFCCMPKCDGCLKKAFAQLLDVQTQLATFSMECTSKKRGN